MYWDFSCQPTIPGCHPLVAARILVCVSSPTLSFNFYKIKYKIQKLGRMMYFIKFAMTTQNCINCMTKTVLVSVLILKTNTFRTTKVDTWRGYRLF